MTEHLTRRFFVSRSLAAATAATLPQWPGAANAARPTTPVVDVRPAAAEDPTELTVAEAAALIRRGDLTSEALVRACLRRVAEYDDIYLAFNTVLEDQAIREAKRRDREPPRGPLHGVPLAIKDLFFTEGVRTTANSFIFEDFVPPYTATVVDRLVAEGGIVLGKTQMGPLATTRATLPNGELTTVNAWSPLDVTVDPGGSSTGSATAVAGRMAPGSTGTQTGGSITSPSNAQNLTGLKPTHGRVSVYGAVPLTYTRDHPGPIARDVLDAALLLHAMAGEDPQDPRTQGLPPLPDLVRAATPVRRGGRVVARRRTRIGVPPGYLDDEPPVVAARRAMLDTLDGIRGFQMVDVELPDEWELLTDTFNDVRLPERSEPFREYLTQDLRLFGVSLLNWLRGLFLSGDEWITGQRAKLALLTRLLDGVFEECDVVVQTDPVPLDIVGLPELGFPIGFGGDPVLPIGTILGAPPYEEDRLVEVVAAYQAVTDWHLRRPEDPAADAATRARISQARVAHRLTPVEAARQSQ
jgi:Asp-tRNA(Asn)/Glu-tRNA(Gln) amidotransferase A subunit family amidase